MNWFAIYTKPLNEIKVAQKLQAIGIEAYCPTITVVKQWSDRKKKVTQPLFNSYVFVKLNEKDRPLVFAIPGVVRYLFWLGKPAVIKEAEITAIRELLQQEYQEIRVSSLVPGSKITIEQGVFKGQLATFQEQQANKIVLILDSLGFKLVVHK
ncbi:UpxY family transcription antiterminator [Polaribacter gangjinensis]|uniref:Antitermination protein NusG n=1 Tax=Polaribacter gangjinensis TaxID=574710 RepID=A0A2S7W833_9FLAO|nr:UpxY family transcription antiterminator [Polaribacter gangjinensis]PQJ73788.1 antitermination protein NusG [Polaribacter gangjinensis]